MSTLAWDDREWMRDEIVIQSDDWLSIDGVVNGVMQRQAAEIRRSLDMLVRLRANVELRADEIGKIDATIKALRDHLVELRSAMT